MRFAYLLLFTCMCINSVSGQIANKGTNKFNTTYDRTIPNSNIWTESEEKIALKEGTPFFQNEWAKGKILTPDRSLYQNIDLKIDLMRNRVHYLDSSGKELVVTVPLKEVWLERFQGGTPAHFVDGHMLPSPKVGLYLVLVDDTISLVKGFRKYYQEHIAYGMAPEYIIKTDETYFVYFYQEQFIVNKPSDFIRIFPNKKAEIEQQIKKMDKKVKKDEQLSLMATFCNTLSGLSR